MTILFEGIDRCGKTTQIKLIQPYLIGKPLHILHYSNFSGFNNNDEVLKYSKEVYSQMFDFINDKRHNLICDRAHLGEFVWGGIYRYSLEDSKYVFDLEKKIIDQNDVVMYVLIDSSLGNLKRDDGLSLYKNEIEAMNAVKRFREAYQLSNIRNKYLIDIAGKSIEDVHNIIKAKLLPIIGK